MLCGVLATKKSNTNETFRIGWGACFQTVIMPVEQLLEANANSLSQKNHESKNNKFTPAVRTTFWLKYV